MTTKPLSAIAFTKHPDCEKRCKRGCTEYCQLLPWKTEAARPDGYAVLLDDSLSAPDGFWFVGCYTQPDIAVKVAAKNRGRMVPIYFAPSHEQPRWIEEELKDGDRICEAAGVQRTEGGRLPVAKIINAMGRPVPPHRSGGATMPQAEPPLPNYTQSSTAPLGYVWPDTVDWLKTTPMPVGTVNLHKTQEDPSMVPVYLGQPSAIVPRWAEEELKDGDRICEALGLQRTEGGRLPVAKIINKLIGRQVPPHRSGQ